MEHVLTWNIRGGGSVANESGSTASIGDHESRCAVLGKWCDLAPPVMVRKGQPPNRID
jgi:hypothetical protein